MTALARVNEINIIRSRLDDLYLKIKKMTAHAGANEINTAS
jgi:hypothetical protein